MSTFNRLELKVPPVALVLVTAAAMWVVARAAPALTLPLPPPYRDAIALGLVLAGVVVSILGVAAFKRAKTTVNPMNPSSSSALVVLGIYRQTRNPMYLGLALALCGWGAFLSNALALTLLPGFVLYMNRFQIEPEERALERRFGREFVEYTRRARRWL